MALLICVLGGHVSTSQVRQAGPFELILNTGGARGPDPTRCGDESFDLPN